MLTTTLVDHLSERERLIVELRFGQSMTQSQIAERIGVSQMQVSRLLTRALGDDARARGRRGRCAVRNHPLQPVGSSIRGVSASAGDLAHTHLVAVYDRNDELAATVAEFLADAIAKGGTAVVIATLAHRRAIASVLGSLGADVDALIRAGRYRSLDARDALDSFMRDAHVDPDVFLSYAAETISSSAAAGRPVHVYGEMVALLWDEGNVAAALDLESLWNRLGARERFKLFCGYSRSSLEERGDLTTAKAMCDRHSAVLPLTAPSRARRAERRRRVRAPLPRRADRAARGTRLRA